MDASDMHNKTKRLIRSILTSNPCNMTIRTLARDYRAMVDSKGIPFSELGYNSLEHYLRSIPDVVQVQGNGMEATLVAVVSTKIAHINEMVVKQKIEVKRNVPSHLRQRRRYCQPVPQPRDVQHSESYEYISSSSALSDIDTVPPPADKDHQHPNKAPITPADIENRMQKCLEKVCRETSEQIIGISKAMKTQLSNLMLRHPNGIWCRDLPKLFYQNYGRVLDYQHYGYVNLIDMISKLDTIFQYVQPETDDFLLFHAKQDLPEDILSKIGQDEIQNESFCVFDVNTDLDPFDYPEDALRLGRRIKGITASKLIKKRGCNTFDVVLTQPYSPYNFWMYLKESPLEKLSNDMYDFFIENAQKYRMPSNSIIAGIYCVKLRHNQYYRCLIRDIENDLVLTCFIDYGVQAWLPKLDFFFMPEKFANLKAQGIRCALSNVFPIPAFEPWSLKAKQFFQNLVEAGKRHQFQIVVKKVNPINALCHFDVELCYRNDNGVMVNLNNKFIKAGYAQMGEDVRKLYTYS